MITASTPSLANATEDTTEDTTSPVFCWICRQDQEPSRTLALSSCGHRFCASCLSSTFTMQFLAGEKASACCYRPDKSESSCGRMIDDDDAQRLLAPEIWRLYLDRSGILRAPSNQADTTQQADMPALCRCGRRDSVPYTTLSSCGHHLCVPCVSSLVTHSIMEGRINWTCTFLTDDTRTRRLGLSEGYMPCGSSIAEDDIKEMLCPYMWAKFQWLTRLKSDPKARICGFTEFLASSNLFPTLEDGDLDGRQPLSREDINQASAGDSSADSSVSTTENDVVDAVIDVGDPHYTGTLDTTAFLCRVCMESEPISGRVELRACGHIICRRCIAKFLTTGIHGGRVDFTCFYHVEGEGPNSSRMCAAPISSGEIESLVSPTSWTKFSRFALFKSSDLARECPFCLTAQVTNASPANPRCVCSSCNEIFCLVHSNAHSAGETCADYEKRQPRLEKRSKVHVKKIAKPCPGCERPIERAGDLSYAGGCMHMTCTVCNANFCWLCCEPWTNSYTHFDPFESSGCRYTYKHHIEAISSTRPLVRGIAYVVFYTTMALFGVPAAIIVTFCRVLLCKKATAAIAVTVIRLVGIFSTSFILRTAFVVGVVGSAFFGCLGVFTKILCSRCRRTREAKPTEIWLPVATPTS